MIVANGPGNWFGDGLELCGCGISGAVRIRRTDPFPRVKEKDEQHDRQRDNEGGSNDGSGASVKRVREGLLEDVETHTKKCHNDESGQAPEGVHQAAAKNQ